MIDSRNLHSWADIFHEIGEPTPRRNRARCPIHKGDSPSSLSVNEDRGTYHCFVCGAKGDKVSFVRTVLGIDFKAALAFFGLTLGRPRRPDSAAVRQRAAMRAVRDWLCTTGRRLRNEFYSRQRIIKFAREKLTADPEGEMGWELLRIAYDGESRLEHLLDQIDLCRTDQECLSAWRAYRNAVD